VVQTTDIHDGDGEALSVFAARFDLLPMHDAEKAIVDNEDWRQPMPVLRLSMAVGVSVTRSTSRGEGSCEVLRMSCAESGATRSAFPSRA
jgi:hypothetical protein